ncbi:hypothetical protein [Roseovarius aestuariivivens]|uniref:hypothetical protein n=1 Tax=Roseovarius aestuariivivens TaxID=1888910 RepID=UPI001AEC0252|nr:hypothetical protein [Roseovarius aestuariivivens]
MFRRFFLLIAGLALTACTNPNDLDKTPVYLGNFHLGHNVVVAPNLTKGPASREASQEEWIAYMTKAIDERFSRYEGTRLYHLGISIEGYVLAVPGIPLVASPKSALILNVTVWDDAKQAKLNAKPETVTVVESISGNTILGSGVTQSKEVQMKNLSRNAAKLIQNWLVRQNNAEGWFEDDGVPANDKPASQKRYRPATAAEQTAANPSRAPEEATPAE